SHDDVDIAVNELGSEVGNLIERSLRPGIDDGKILSLDVTVLAQGITECPQHRGRRNRASKKTNPDLFVPLALLCACRERPRRRAAEQRDERAPFHSITSSASCCSCNGTSRPTALAVLMLTTSSNLVGACTGRSAGFSPLRMRSTYEADRRTISPVSGPKDINAPSLAYLRKA